MVTPAVRVVPEAHRHAGERPRADQFALSPTLAVIVEHVDVHAEAAALQLAAVHRQHRVAEHEARNNVGAAGDRHTCTPGLIFSADVVEDSGESGEPVDSTLRSPSSDACVVVHAGLVQRVDVFGAGAEHVDAGLLGELESEHVGDGMKRRAVVQHQRRPSARPLTSQFHIIQPQVVK